MAQMGDESEDETPDTGEDDGKNFLLSDDGKDIDLRYVVSSILSVRSSQLCFIIKILSRPCAQRLQHC